MAAAASSAACSFLSNAVSATMCLPARQPEMNGESRWERQAVARENNRRVSVFEDAKSC